MALPGPVCMDPVPSREAGPVWGFPGLAGLERTRRGVGAGALYFARRACGTTGKSLELVLRGKGVAAFRSSMCLQPEMTSFGDRLYNAET